MAVEEQVAAEDVPHPVGNSDHCEHGVHVHPSHIHCAVALDVADSNARVHQLRIELKPGVIVDFGRQLQITYLIGQQFLRHDVEATCPFVVGERAGERLGVEERDVAVSHAVDNGNVGREMRNHTTYCPASDPVTMQRSARSASSLLERSVFARGS